MPALVSGGRPGHLCSQLKKLGLEDDEDKKQQKLARGESRDRSSLAPVRGGSAASATEGGRPGPERLAWPPGGKSA